ncbi:hypothetical protein J2T11_000151 [Paenarthrobacter nicotinovorans]|nr:hypothetical protein [Paenarthrobacter nicotinovorans]
MGVILGIAGVIIYFLNLGWGKPIKPGELASALFALSFIAVLQRSSGCWLQA